MPSKMIKHQHSVPEKEAKKALKVLNEECAFTFGAPASTAQESGSQAQGLANDSVINSSVSDQHQE